MGGTHILPAIKPGWTSPSRDTSMLAILVRDAPKEAVALLDREPEIGWYPTDKVYETPGGKLPPGVLVWLRGPKAPNSATYQLAEFSEAQDRTLLESRLETLRSQWSVRLTEMIDAQPIPRPTRPGPTNRNSSDPF